MAFKTIQAAWQTPPRPQDAYTILSAFDAMAAMEQEVLGFLDPLYRLHYSFGASNLPDALPENVYPCVLHLPAGQARQRSITTMGGSARIGHPGGLREHEYPFEIYWLVGHRAEEIEHLMVNSAFWCKAVDMAYCANASLGGVVHEVGLSTSYWGGMDWGNTHYYGWIFRGAVRLQYTFQGAG